MAETTDSPQITEECPKSYKAWLAFLLGMACMVVAAAVFERLAARSQVRTEQPAQVGIQAGVLVADAELRAAPAPTAAWFGAQVQDVDAALARELGAPEGAGVLVLSVTDDGPAAQAGIARGDLIVRFDHRNVDSAVGLGELLAEKRAEQRVQVVFVRARSRHTVYVQLQAGPPATGESGAVEGQQVLSAEPPGPLGIALSVLSPVLAQRYNIPDGTAGVVVTSVLPGSAAAQAGLQPGDVIMAVNGTPTSTMASFFAGLDATTLLLDVLREGRRTFVTLVLPDDSPHDPTAATAPGMLPTGQPSSSDDSDTEGLEGRPQVIPPMGKPQELTAI